MFPLLTSLLLAGVVYVTIVTGAPLANQEQAVSLDQTHETGDRLKRAEEQIVFGNQQNKARVMAKKSDASHADEQPTPLGQLDQGAEVIVHKEMPVEEDLAARADAARKDFEDDGKISEAMEAAMASVDAAAEEKDEEEGLSSESDTPAEAEGDGSTPAEDSLAPVSENEADATDDTEEGQDTSDEEDIKDLLQATTGAQQGQSEQGSEENGDGATGEVQEAGLGVPEDISGSQTKEAQSLDSLSETPQEPGSNMNPQNLANYYRQMYQYMLRPYGGSYGSYGQQFYPSYRKRSHGARRIKRDLLDDAVYNRALEQYLYGDSQDNVGGTGMPSGGLDLGDALISSPDDYVPFTDEDAEELYDELEDFLRWELQRREDEERLREILGLEQEDSNEAAKEMEILGQEEDIPDDGYIGYEDDEDSLLNAGEEDEEEEPSFEYGTPYPGESFYDILTKRRANGEFRRGDYYSPSLPTSKRYFFPFAEEPETHWGAFVPEKRGVVDDERSVYVNPYSWREEQAYESPAKRDYDEAIHRLQRLAMALSDNREPYFSEVVQDQPYKK